MLSDKTKLQIIFINRSLGKIIVYYHSWLCSKGVYVYVYYVYVYYINMYITSNQYFNVYALRRVRTAGIRHCHSMYYVHNIYTTKVNHL